MASGDDESQMTPTSSIGSSTAVSAMSTMVENVEESVFSPESHPLDSGSTEYAAPVSSEGHSAESEPCPARALRRLRAMKNLKFGSRRVDPGAAAFVNVARTPSLVRSALATLELRWALSWKVPKKLMKVERK